MKSLRWFVLAVVAGSAASITLATMANRRRRHHTAAAQVHEQRSDLHSWENEGGNVAPVSPAAVSVSP